MQVHPLTGAALPLSAEAAIETVVEAIGSDHAGEKFSRAIRDLAEVDRVYCFEQATAAPGPHLFCAWVPVREAQLLLDQYRIIFHRFDPVRGVLPSLPPTGAAITFASEEIENGDYRAACFDRYAIRHRLTVVKPVGSRWLTLNVARRARAFTPSEIDALSAFGRLAMPMLARNQDLQPRTPGGSFSVPELERRLAVLGKGLTQRERQVCARTLAGISAEGAGLDLGLSTASVLTYRQRAYRRLGVSNALQLAPLVMH